MGVAPDDVGGAAAHTALPSVVGPGARHFIKRNAGQTIHKNMIATENSHKDATPIKSAPGRLLPGREALRVLHVLPFFAYGGTELVVQRLIACLDAPDFEHRVCAMRGFDSDLVRAAHLEGRIVQAGKPSEGFQFPMLSLIRTMREIRPHIVHTRNWGALEAILAARIAGVPITVHSEHGYDLKILDGVPLRQRLVRRGLYSLTDALFTVSNELREFHARQAGISPVRIQVLYNGVDTEQFKPRSELRVAILAELGIPRQCIVVGSVGRMVAIKDYPFTLRIIAGLIGKGLDIHLLLVGTGPEVSTLQELVRASAGLSGRVHFCGFSNRISQLLNGMDIFVQASRAEGMSNTLLEAMASGLPLVAARIGGNPEVISEGETGLLFALDDEAAMSGCIERLANSPELRRRMSEAGRDRALKRFSVEQMLHGYRKLYQDLAVARGIVAAREA